MSLILIFINYPSKVVILPISASWHGRNTSDLLLLLAMLGVVLDHLIILYVEFVVMALLLYCNLLVLCLDWHHVGIKTLLLLDFVVVVQGLDVQLEVAVSGVR